MKVCSQCLQLKKIQQHTPLGKVYCSVCWLAICKVVRLIEDPLCLQIMVDMSRELLKAKGIQTPHLEITK